MLMLATRLAELVGGFAKYRGATRELVLQLSAYQQWPHVETRSQELRNNQRLLPAAVSSSIDSTSGLLPSRLPQKKGLRYPGSLSRSNAPSCWRVPSDEGLPSAPAGRAHRRRRRYRRRSPGACEGPRTS